MTHQPDAAGAHLALPGSRVDDDPRLTAAGLLFEVASGLQAILAAQLADHGLSGSEFEVLLRLARSPGGQLRMTDLARQAGLSASGLTRLADRLERRELIVRRDCPTDRRGLDARITEEGCARVTAVLPGHLELVDRWFTGPLRAEQLTALQDALRTVRAQVRPDADAGAHDGAPSDPAS